MEMLQDLSRKRVFRGSPYHAVLGAAMAILGSSALVAMLLADGFTGRTVLFTLCTVFGLLIFGNHYAQRVEVDEQGVRAFNEFNRRLWTCRWDEIATYEHSEVNPFRKAWHLGTANGKFRLPPVGDSVRLQEAMLARIGKGVLRTPGRSQRSTSKHPGVEIHEAAYRSLADLQNLAANAIYLLGAVAAGGLLTFIILDGRSGLGVFGGFVAGILIVTCGFAIRWILASVRRQIQGKSIDITQEGLFVKMEGVRKAIRWSEVRLVEKTNVASSGGETPSIVLFDGETSISFGANWRHADAIVQFASAKSPAGTVFAGFD